MYLIPKTGYEFGRHKNQKPSKIEREFVFNRENGLCYYCKVPLNRGADDFNRDKNRFTIDHIISRKNGGDNSIDNIVACCRSCNCRKGAKNG